MTTFRITSPDGTVYNVTGPEGATEQQALAQVQARHPLKPPTPPADSPSEESPTSLRNLAGAAVEPNLRLLSGGPAAIAGGLAGLVDIPLNAMGVSKTQPADVVKNVQNAMTYEPKTVGGQNAMKVIGAPGEALGNVAPLISKAMAKAGHPLSPFAESDLEASIQALTTMAGGRAAGKGAGGMTKGSTARPAVDMARAAGYVLKPSEGGGLGGKVAEGLSGSPKLSVEASVKNQVNTNRLAAEEIGLPKGTKVTKDSLKRAKAPHNAVYAEMESLGDISTDKQYQADIAGIGRAPGNSFTKDVDPDIEKLKGVYDEQRFSAKDGVLKIRGLRAKASKNIKAPNAPERNELGFAQKAIADAIEAQMERHAQSIGKADLAARFKAARQSLAKIHSVESATIGGTGGVSAAGLAKQLNRGVPLSGKLKTVADVANEFGEVTRDATKLKNKVPVTVLDGLLAGGLGTAGALGHAAIGGAGLAGMLARPAARKALLSKAYQNRLSSRAPKPRGIAPRAAAASMGVGATQQDQQMRRAVGALP